MKRFQKVYLEISNICNLSCSFCPGTQRPRRQMTEGEFTCLLKKLRPYTDYLYFHLMGEPLRHPLLERFLELAGNYGFRVVLTTNGTLIRKCQEVLLHAPALHKVNISLHAFEANDLCVSFAEYLEDCFAFGRASQGKALIVYRLWNQGGLNNSNEAILRAMKQAFPEPWIEERRGIRIGQRVFLEYGDKFEWPNLQADELGDSVFCYGLRDQLGVLCDGTVVPCCLDHEGDIPLGNLLRESMDDILSSRRAKDLFDGFSRRSAVEPLCRRCGYARRFG